MYHSELKKKTSRLIVIKFNTKKIEITLNKVLCKNAEGQTLSCVRVHRTLLVVVKRLQAIDNGSAPTLSELFQCVISIRLPHRLQSRLKLLQSLFLSRNFLCFLLVCLHKTLSFFPHFFPIPFTSFV